MVHLAWLHATPKKAKTPRIKMLQAKKDSGDAVPELDVPEVPFCMQHLLEVLFEAGPGAAGEKLTATELRDWKEGTGAVLDSFQFSAVLQMSAAYMGMRHQAIEPDCKLPRYDVETHEQVQERRERVNAGPHALAERFGADKQDGPKRMARRK